MATKGVPAPEAAAAFTRAHELCQLVEETSLLPRVLWGLILFHTSQVQLRAAGALCQQLFHLAQREHDSDLLQEAHLALGRVELYRGHVVVSRAHLEQSLPRDDTPLLCSPLFPGGYMLRVIHLTSFAHALWASGYTDQAQQRVQEALDLAHQEEHPPSLSWAQASAALVAQYRRDVAATQAHTEGLMAFAAAQGFRSRLAQGRMLRGWALAMQGDAAEGLVQIQQGWAVHQSVGPKRFQTYFLALLAEASGQAGQPEVGLDVLAEALRLLHTTEERWWEAEVYRLQAELLLLLPRPRVHEAEAWLHRALDVAHSQQAKTLELRAALSLSRLWQRQGKGDEARQLLTPLYGWFTEGFDTPDLREATALLDGLP